MKRLAICAAGLLALTSGWAASAPAPTSAEILESLSRHSGQALTSGFEVHRGEGGVWHVRADTAAARSASSGFCERTRIFAEVSESSSSEGTWRVLRTEPARAVAPRDTSPSCENLPSSEFIAIPDSAEPGDVELLMSAIEQMQPCARKSRQCKTQIVATPWSLLDEVGNARKRATVLWLDFDPNFSHANLRVYDIQFTIENTKRRYSASVSIVDGSLNKMEIFEVVE